MLDKLFQKIFKRKTGITPEKELQIMAKSDDVPPPQEEKEPESVAEAASIPSPQEEKEPESVAETEPIPSPQKEKAPDIAPEPVVNGTLDEQKEQLVWESMQKMLEHLQPFTADNPPTGGERFAFPGTKNIVGFYLLISSQSTGRLMLNTYAIREEPMFSLRHYGMAVGRLDDIRAYLADKSHVRQLLESIQGLSDDLDAKLQLDSQQLLQEKRRNSAIGCVKIIQEKAKAEIPAEGPFSPVDVCTDFPGTQNVVGISIKGDVRNPSLCRMNIYAYREGTDMVVNHFGQGKPLKEIMATLADESYVEEVLESFQQLSDNVDDKW